MKEILKKILTKILILLPIENIIIMESNPDFTDSVKTVFDELIKNKVNEKYKIIWFVSDNKKFKEFKIKNVKFLKVKSSKFNIFIKIRKYINISKAKIIIDSNNFIPKVREEQIRVHISHGTPLKNASNYNEGIGDVDYIVELSDFFKEFNSKSYKVDKSKLLDFGFPRNDVLLKKVDKKKYFPEYDNKKIIVWLPTYRKHTSKNNYGNSSLKYGIPCFNNEDDFKIVDEKLKELNIIILFKLHPAQDRKILESFNTENIKIITDDELLKKKINLYELLAISDAMITDYSSVYYDYLITKKMIGLAISDFNEYEKEVGFVYNFFDVVKGDYIYNKEELIEFIQNISTENDIKKDERLLALKKFHTFEDNKSTERIFNLIKKYL